MLTMPAFALTCLICGDRKEISSEDATEAHYYNCSASIYICDDCRNAVMFAKEMQKMCQRQTPIYDDGRYICPNCRSTLISVAGQDDKGRLGVKFCIHCGQAVKWDA